MVEMMRKSGVLLLGVFLSAPVLAANAGGTSAPATTAAPASKVSVPAPGGGAVRYVTDSFQITLRSGPGLRYGIVRMLSTGETLQVLKQDKRSGYTQVRTPGGAKGWVLTRYLLAHPTASEQLKAARQRLAHARSQVSSLSATLAKTKTQLSAKIQSEAKLSSRFSALQKTYLSLRKTSKNAVAVATENQALKQRVATLSKHLSTVSRENAALHNAGLLRWFLAGGAVLLIGLILGLLMPRLTHRRRDTWFN